MAYVPTYHDVHLRTSAGEADIHYLEAGAPTLPTIILYHGFPSSSTQYRDFIPMLSDEYHVLAPDFPGFGLTTVSDDFPYTFENITIVMKAWIKKLHVQNYAMYIFDYGAPIGLRIALEQPKQVHAIISQNGNAYKEGFGQNFWNPIFNLWNSHNSEEARMIVRDNVLTPAATKYQYEAGVPEVDLHLINPALSYYLDYASNIEGEENKTHQLDLFYDYRTNVDMYPQFQQYFKDTQVPMLAVWGKGDPAFIPPGAEAFKRDLPAAEVLLLDTGHFALETKRWQVARTVKGFLSSVGF
ncbi:alpha/beta-hydrolase [Teratosphaeria nubilosa]|uniref:Alpha/beta-hydrolase n=1 Tax=Teratosphaeria nubilosa TaxID=161662 RepID=A0A6G1L150_9PEZI|nr:alpha/beta-hydrolase [Teratosphaeria nubilosa]